MRYAITGATGFVGKHLCRALTALGHEVVAIHRSSGNSLGREFALRNVTFDMESGSAVPNDALNVDALLHLAWPGLPNYNSIFHFERGLPCSYSLIRQYIESGVRHVLVTGTCFEYGARDGALSENMRPDPRNPYAIAKDSLRRFLVCFQEERNFTLQWVRLFYLYGVGQHSRTLLSQLDLAIDRGDQSFDMSPGDQLRDYLPIEEVARRLTVLAQRPELDGIFNCASGKPISVRTLVERRIHERGSNIKLNLGRRSYSPFEPMAFWGDVQRTSELFAQ